MPKLIFLCVAFTITFASSAFAYTYTCQEGKFTIDIPNESKIEMLGGNTIGFNIGVNRTETDMNITWFDTNSNTWKDIVRQNNELSEIFVLSQWHNVALKWLKDNRNVISIDKYLTYDDINKMNVDSGFIIFATNKKTHENGTIASFVNDIRVFTIICGFGIDRDTAISVLNSFRAID